MSGPELSMLWERDVDPAKALQERFGFEGSTALSAWLRQILDEHWAIPVRAIERIVLSDHNALGWVRSHQGSFVVKVCANQTLFARLGEIAGVVAGLGAAGVPVPVPVATGDGELRVVTATARNPLSVIVQPLVAGEFLNMSDLRGAHAAGASLAHLHRAAAQLPQSHGAGVHLQTEPDLRERLTLDEQIPGRDRAPRATARLDGLLADLPDLDTPVQVVHNDFRGANLLMADSQVAAILDFDEMSIDHPVCDLGRAMVLLATRFTTWDPTPAPVQRALVQGYTSVLPLSDLQAQWAQAVALGLGIASIPPGRDPAGWAKSIEQGL